jgi:hypothetical protein
MQFITTALLPVIALLTATAHAADCYSQHGSKSCLSRDDLYFARDVR